MRWVTPTRTTVRTIASVISQAWYASSVVTNVVCEAARARSRPTARTWLRLEIPRPRGMAPVSTGSSVGSPMVATTNAVHIAGPPAGSVQPTASVSSAAGADSVRRRLSSIFQRPMAGIERDPEAKIHGSSCQSPRAHRC